jgi:hypothetical protein
LILTKHVGANWTETIKKRKWWDFGDDTSHAQLGRLVSVQKAAEKAGQTLASHAPKIHAHQGQALLDFSRDHRRLQAGIPVIRHGAIVPASLIPRPIFLAPDTTPPWAVQQSREEHRAWTRVVRGQVGEREDATRSSCLPTPRSSCRILRCALFLPRLAG